MASVSAAGHFSMVHPVFTFERKRTRGEYPFRSTGRYLIEVPETRNPRGGARFLRRATPHHFFTPSPPSPAVIWPLGKRRAASIHRGLRHPLASILQPPGRFPERHPVSTLAETTLPLNRENLRATTRTVVSYRLQLNLLFSADPSLFPGSRTLSS